MNIDVVKEKINWYKLLFTIFVTATVGCIGWLTGNFNTNTKFLMVCDGIVIVVLSIGISVVVYKIRFYLKRLGDF